MVLLNAYHVGNRKPNSALFWEYDMKTFDWQKSKNLVVQRIIELGEPEDFFAAFDMYGGIEGFKEVIKSVAYLNDLDIHFVCTIFELKKEELRCYTKRQSNLGLWNF